MADPVEARRDDIDDGDDYDYPVDCSRCGGDGYDECDDPIQCMEVHVNGLCPCACCGGSGLAKDQTIW